MPLANVIMDVDGLELSAEEKEMVAHPSVAGVILFSRNYQDKKQLLTLTNALRQINSNLIIAVDQEGGRVQRFQDGFTSLPTMRYWGEQFEADAEKAVSELTAITTIMVKELHEVGVNLSIAPVLDFDYALNTVIGDRSFGCDGELISRLGRVVVDTMHVCGMTSVAKHFPGHGGVTADSHFDLPVDRREWDLIWQNDMLPFRQLLSQYDALMPAHIIFSKVKNELVSYSRFWLNDILRDKLGFTGAIMSDDLNMNAATHIGDYQARTEAAIDAGCDLLIACNQRAGTIKVIESSSRYTANKTNHYLEQYLMKFALTELVAN